MKISIIPVKMISVITAAFLLFSSCAKVEKSEMYVSFFTGSVALQRDGAPVEINVKDLVRDGDIFTVGEKSTLILQSTDGLLVRCESNTEAVISSINDISKREVSLNRGKVLSSLGKLQKGYGYTVKTPTAVASVRGTQFLTEFDGKNSVVAVGSGVVSVKRSEGAADEKLVEKGSSAVALEEKDTVELRGVNKVESLELSKLEKTPVVEGLKSKTPEQLKEIFKDQEKTDEMINQEIDEGKPLTMAEMKEKYGRVDVITLYSGRVIQGVIISRGASYKVLTTAGPVTVKAKDVRRTDVR